MAVQSRQDMYLPLVTPQTPPPDIYPQYVFYLHMSSNPADRLRLFIEGGRKINVPPLSVRNRLRKLEFKLDGLVWRIAGIL